MSELLSISDSFNIAWHQWGIAFLAAFTLGFSKAGIKGLGVVIVTLMALVFGGKVSTGIVIPLLIVADILAVIYYNRSADWHYLFKLLPWMVIGVLLGVYAGKDLPEVIFKQGMAVIILITVAMMFWWDRQKEAKIPENWWFAGVMGLSAGFTTMIGNLAGAFTNIFYLAMRIPKNVFIGTTAWLFFIINIFKLPFHIWVWETVGWETFAVNLRLIPGVFLGFYVGVKVVERIHEEAYRKMILILTALGAIMIFLR
ncbi:MAG: putative membrane protein YfcA [Saprospiraceae bacterium]|jgi:uncharacterized membrane protein YfcA